jgi:hypothetical protein
VNLIGRRIRVFLEGIYLNASKCRKPAELCARLLCLGLCVGWNAPSFGQAVNGSISGTVKDETGSVVEGATAVFVNKSTGVQATSTTNGDGIFRGFNLQPGTYDLQISANGFSHGVRSGIVLNVGSDARVDFVLRVAVTDQTVSVVGNEAGVELESTTLSYDVNGTTVRELPLNGRDFTSLATLQPSVSTLNGQGASSGSMRAGRGKALTISGNRPAANNFLFDGISMNDQSNNTPGSILGVTLGVDAIDQFTLIADTFPAEYGNASGGILNAVTRSGTNHIHGSGFYFGRNSVLDSLNYFDSSSLPHPEFTRNQYGASAGGPLIKDKAFWFADFEAIGQLQGLTQYVFVPAQSAWANANPAIQKFQSFYPTTTVEQDANAKCPTTFSCYDTIPIVNTSNGSEQYGLGKINYTINSTNSLAGSYYIDLGSYRSPDSFNNQRLNSLTHRMGTSIEYTSTISPRIVNIARVGFSRNLDQADPANTEILNPALKLKGPGYDFVPGKGVGGISVTNLTSLTASPTATDYNNAAYNSFQEYDNLLITKGKHSFKFGASMNRMQNNNIGTNLLGGSFTVTSSLISFLQNGNLTKGNTSSIAGTYGSTLNSFTYPNQAGSPTYVGTHDANLRNYRQSMIGMFAQDSWRIFDNLTLNYGLRYEFVTIPTEVAGKTAILRHLTDSAPTVGGPMALGNPSLKGFSPRVGISYDPFHNGKTAIRAGFGLYDSLDLLNEYDLVFERSFPYNTQESLATSNGINLNNSFPSTAYCLGAQDDTTTGNIDPAFAVGGNCYGITPQSSLSLRTAYIDPNPPRSYIMSWNLNVEKQLGAWGVTIGYVGSRGVHLLEVERNINSVMPIKTTRGWFYPAVKRGAPLAKLNPNFASINCSATFNIDSEYEALHVSVNRNLRRGLQVIGSFAYGKSLDDASSTASTSSGTGYPYAIGSPQPLLTIINRGRSDFDIKNNATISAVYEVPDNHFKSRLLHSLAKGYEASAVYRVQTGPPFTVTLTGDEPYIDPNNLKQAYYGQTETDTTGVTTGERPNVVPNCKVTNPGNIAHYINTSCFTYPNQSDAFNGTPGTYLGNESRNSISAPGYQNVDISFMRNDRIGEHVNGQFRLELFNAANHPNFAAPSTRAGLAAASVNTSTGTITTAAGPISSFNGQILSTGGNISRQIQFGYKVTF